ncbi:MULTISPECIES: phenylacetate--CoA ligase family protein [unclassified Rhizobacter]|uniref:phenylacetate--CoA ligase family protein n=1 Tax=unclassified Rhizobacter TaxID=2640088 RepID=UPI0006F1C8FE|nr:MULTISPECIES: AMP-binding protein [unclassified Rhizobacter]KQU68403.1 AMP-dependent synthetase [Rhizobacter sp. Root29]KQW14509.1 AMP-dependent synthetase [Rhizobacter sp. Root1238]KRB16715.1 AMP-dependent synthetase [Rhizobacter sp. Root16D2]
MGAFFDALETREPAERERALFGALPALLAHAQAHAPAFAALPSGLQADRVTDRAALAALPVTRKSELLARQQAQRSEAVADDVFGGFSTIGWRGLRRPNGARRVFQSPGPIYEPEGEATDYWRAARALHAAGFRAGDLVHNSFSYHLTPAGSMMEGGALAIGCTVFPGGVGNTELQLQAMRELRPHGYVGTPSFLKILVDKAVEAGASLGSVQRALVSGEAFPPSLRDWLRGHGIEGYQCYATADLGLIAYETEAREGLVLDEGVIVEIVRPGTGDPVPEGEVGELVVTTLNPDYPLVRFGTGDLSAVLPGMCPTGRTNTRIKGWMGRADQTAKVRGMFVHPSQVAEVVKRFPEIVRARLVVSGEMASDRMTLRVEVAQAAEGLVTRVADAIRDVTKLRGEVELCAPGSLPNDGRVIEDARKYD